jgi:hypothetical protein
MTIGSQAQEKFDQGKAFGTTFSIIGRNIGLWLALTTIFSVLPSAILQYLLLGPVTESALSATDLTTVEWRLYAIAAAGLLVSIVLSALLSSTLVRATIEDMSGKRPSMRDCIGTAGAVLLPAVGVGLLTSLGVVAGLIFLIIPGVVLWLRWAVAIPVLVQERLGVTASISRSATLTAGFLWPLFGLFLILVIAAGLIEWAIAGIQPSLGLWPGLLIAAFVESIMSMVISTATAVCYVELRRIKEGTGVEELAEIFS